MKLLENIFQHYILLMFMLFVPIIIGLGIGYILPPSYQASANLWALERFQIIGSTGPESNLQTTPAGTQADALTEMLQSRTFDVAVGAGTNLKSTLKLSAQDLSNPQKLNDAYVADISKNVQVVAKGTNLYAVIYTNSNPRIAFQVLNAVINQFQVQGQQFSIVQGQNLLQEDESQLTQMQDAALAAATNESAYLTHHPGSTITNDPEYALLNGQRLQAQTTLQNMETTIANLKQDIARQNAGGGAFFKTLDPPVVPDSALSRSKVLITSGSIGFALGLITCILYILIIVRRDRALYSAFDLQKVTFYPVIMQIPQLPNSVKEFILIKFPR